MSRAIFPEKLNQRPTLGLIQISRDYNRRAKVPRLEILVTRLG